MSANFDAEIAQRIKAKGKPGAPEQLPSRIEDLALRIDALRKEHHRLDCASLALYSAKEKNDADIDVTYLKIEIDGRMERHGDHIAKLAEAISLENPTTLREALIFAAMSRIRLNDEIWASRSEDESFLDNACSAINRMLEGIIDVLSHAAGVMPAELGVATFESKPTPDLIAEAMAVCETSGVTLSPELEAAS